MGLSICRSIIDAHGGRLWTEANAPGGAIIKFTIGSESGDGGLLCLAKGRRAEREVASFT
jgi:hypothetical protein